MIMKINIFKIVPGMALIPSKRENWIIKIFIISSKNFSDNLVIVNFCSWMKYNLGCGGRRDSRAPSIGRHPGAQIPQTLRRPSEPKLTL